MKVVKIFSQSSLNSRKCSKKENKKFVREDTLELEMISSKFLKFHKISTHRMFLPSLSIIWLESEKKIERFASLIMFQASTPPLIDYRGNNEWPIVKLLILKDDLYIGIKSHKVS